MESKDGEVNQDLTSGMYMPDDPSGYEPGEPRDEGFDDFDGWSLAPGGSSRRGRVVLTTELSQGDRIRATLAWNACVADQEDPAPFSPAVDFDLFLRNSTTGEYVFGSHSFDDVSEGFDVVIQDLDAPGEYELIVGWFDGATACDGGSSERYHWSAVVMRE